MKAIILAGGKGRRLEPYTTVLPKPLMPIGDMPIIEIVIRQLSYYGIKDIIIAVGYLGELIEAFLGDGKKYKVRINYSREEQPLGTAGPISLIKGLDEAFMVLNGDLLTSMDHSKLVEYHKANSPLVTIGVCDCTHQVDLGVLKIDNNSGVQDYIEKPLFKYQVSMGIYVFEPEVIRYIPKNKKMDLPDLIKTLIFHKEKVLSYHCKDFWLDIGRRDDYEKAVREFESKKNLFVKEV